jgi:formate hydrogenlyase subunit 6/NADH:ubiquinone oxidoreductase subunit I
MGITFRHLFKRTTVIQYPDEKQDLGPRTRGVIALKEENCTVCMLCARECPDWCIYIDSHKETLPPKREGGRPRKRNVLDRFAIDYALCMYCGICVEVCPYDALFWSREFEYAEYDIRELTHEKERLSDWMATVLPPPPLEAGAEQPGQPAAAAAPATQAPAAQPTAGTASAAPTSAQAPPATAAPTDQKAKGASVPTASPTMAPENATPTDTDRLPAAPGAVEGGGSGPGSAQRPAPPAAVTAAEERPEQAARATAPAEAPAPTEEQATPSQAAAGETKADGAQAGPTEPLAPAGSAAQPEAEASGTGTAVQDEATQPGTEDLAKAQAPDTLPGDAPSGDTATHGEPPVAAAPNVQVPHEEPRPVALEPAEDSNAIYQQVLQEQLDKGSSPQVAEARARVARAKAERGIKRGPTPVEVEKPVPSAPMKGQQQPPEPSGAPKAETPQPDPGPVAPTASEGGSEPEPAPPQPSEAQAASPPQAAATETPAPQAEAAPAASSQEEDGSGGTESGQPPDDRTEETKPEKIVETVAPGEPGSTDEPQSEDTPDSPAPEAAQQSASSGGSPDEVYQRVYEEQKAKGSSEMVAVARAKAAQKKAQRGDA